MNKLAILYNYFYNFKINSITIGGIQTYISDLIVVARKIGYSVTLFQKGEANNEIVFQDYRVVEIPTNNNDEFCGKVADSIDKDTLVLFATDSMIPRANPFKTSIAIQHGISWDMPNDVDRNFLLMSLSKLRRDINIIKQVHNVNELICVDYNFVNWYRTCVDKPTVRLKVIPNYTRIASVNNKDSDMVKIIFARRMWWYRGTRVFVEAIGRILKEYENVMVTIAGTGPDLDLMKASLSSFQNVEFITYKSDESLSIHSDKHIAVVPTVGSEGTSLSLLEAMSSQCAVVASNVGGITNILLDGYNGLMTNAGDSQELYEALKRLLDDKELLNKLANNGYETVKQAFSHEKWFSKWSQVLNMYYS